MSISRHELNCPHQEARPAGGPGPADGRHGRGRPVRAEHAAGRRAAPAAAQADLPAAVGGQLLLDAAAPERGAALLLQDAAKAALGGRIR